MGKHLKQKAQVALEFVLLVSMAFLVLVIFTANVRDKIIDMSDEEEYIMVKDLTYMVQNEINLAARVYDGFNRTFYIPYTLDGNDFTISIESNQVITQSDNHEFLLQIHEIQGNLTKGNNTITKIGGVVYLNE